MKLGEVLRFMLEELESNRLEVCKIPTRRESADGCPESGYIRVPVSVNAEWYRRFCGNYARPRGRSSKPRTIIKRCDTVKALKRMLSDGDRTTVYAQRLLAAAAELWESMGDL